MPDTRDKLIELLDDIQRCGEDFTEYEIYGMRLPNTVCNDDVADHLIAHGVTIATDNNVGSKWIPVTERLPEDGVQVLACTKHGKAFPAHCEGRKWRVSHSVTITHWMPLPEPPEV